MLILAAGGWGKPPVDETGAPLYGDVFGQDAFGDESDNEVDKTSRWGELEAEVEESEEEEEEEEELGGERRLRSRREGQEGDGEEVFGGKSLEKGWRG